MRHATFTINTEDVNAKQLTASFWAFLDNVVKPSALAGTAGSPLDLTDNIGTVINGANDE